MKNRIAPIRTAVKLLSFYLFKYILVRVFNYFSLAFLHFFYSCSIYIYNKHRSSYLLSEIMKHKKHMNTLILSLPNFRLNVSSVLLNGPSV